MVVLKHNVEQQLKFIQLNLDRRTNTTYKRSSVLKNRLKYKELFIKFKLLQYFFKNIKKYHLMHIIYET